MDCVLILWLKSFCFNFIFCPLYSNTLQISIAYISSFSGQEWWLEAVSNLLSSVIPSFVSIAKCNVFY